MSAGPTDIAYTHPETIPILDRPKSSPSTMSSTHDRSSPPVLVFSSGYPPQQGGYYSYPSSTPSSYGGYPQPVTPFSRVDDPTHLHPYSTWSQTPAPVGGHPMPLAGTPAHHRSHNTTAAPSILFRPPHSLYGSPSSSISSAFPPQEKELAQTPPPLDLSSRRSSYVSDVDSNYAPYYIEQGGLQTGLFGHAYAAPITHEPFGTVKPEGQVKKRSRTAQACDKCRIRKAKCSGGQPCTRCINKKLDCAFSGTSRSRGAARYKHDSSRLHVDDAAKLKERRHSLDDPFATPTCPPVIRRHSEGNVDPHLSDDLAVQGSALGLNITPQLCHSDTSVPSSVQPALQFPTYGLPTPANVPYYYHDMRPEYPWTPDSPAMHFQRYPMSDVSNGYPFPQVPSEPSQKHSGWQGHSGVEYTA